MKKYTALGLLLLLVLAVAPLASAQEAGVVEIPEDITGTVAITIDSGSLVAGDDGLVLTLNEYSDLAATTTSTEENGLRTGIYGTEALSAAWAAYNSEGESVMSAPGALWIVTEGLADEEISGLLLEDGLSLLYFELTVEAILTEDELPAFAVTVVGGDEMDKTVEEGVQSFGSAVLFIELDSEVAAALQAGSELRRPFFGQSCIPGVSCP